MVAKSVSLLLSVRVFLGETGIGVQIWPHQCGQVAFSTEVTLKQNGRRWASLSLLGCDGSWSQAGMRTTSLPGLQGSWARFLGLHKHEQFT